MTGPAAASSSQRVTEEDTKSAAGRVLTSVLDLPGLAPAAEPLVEPLGKALMALVEPVDSLTRGSGLARRLLDMMVGQSARDESTVAEALATEQGRPDDSRSRPPDPTPPPWPDLLGTLMAELAEHVAAEDAELRREARAALRQLGDEMVGLRAIAVALPGGKGPSPEAIARAVREIAKRAEKLKKVMERLEKLFGKIAAPRFRLALQLLRAELVSLAPDRAAIATGLAAPGFLAEIAMRASPDVRESPSSTTIGTEVHEELQRAYRNTWIAPQAVPRSSTPFLPGEVVQDGLVYRTPTAGMPLMAAARANGDGTLWALLFARLPESTVQRLVGNRTMEDVWSMYREDVLDLRTGEVWEIKPMRSAPVGVYQELQYRHAFNLVNAMLLDVRDVLLAGGAIAGSLGKRTKFLKSLTFSRELPLIPGREANWLPIKRAFVVGKGAERLVAVPLTVPQLPGLVLYLLLRVPKELLAILSATLAKLIADAIEKRARDLAKFLEETLEALARAARWLLAGLAIVVALVLFWEVFAAEGAMAALAALARLVAQYAPALGAGALGAATLGAGTGGESGEGSSRSILDQLVERARAEKLKLLAPPVVIGEELVVQLAPVDQGRGQAALPVIDVAVANVRILGLPLMAKPIVDALVAIGVHIGAGVYAKFLAEEEGQV